ncbi:MAG: hypothetical protein ACHQIL_06475 [Steroidobacterales bacterium]
MSSTTAPTVLVEFRDQVAWLTLARPDSEPRVSRPNDPLSPAPAILGIPPRREPHS